jgi:hypothetical protein
VGPEKVNCISRISYLNFIPQMQESRVTEERKFAILFATTLLAARKFIDLDPNKPNMAKGFLVDRAIADASFIPRTNRCAIAYDCEFVFRENKLVQVGERKKALGVESVSRTHLPTEERQSSGLEHRSSLALPTRNVAWC